MPQQNNQPSIKNNEMYKYFGQDNTPLQKLYLEVEARVVVEANDLRKKYDNMTFGLSNDSQQRAAKLKITEIKTRLMFLQRTLFIKENIQDFIHLTEHKKDNDIDLYKLLSSEFNTIDELLDYKAALYNENDKVYYIQESLREALNISVSLGSLTYGLVPFFSPLWGKANTLEKVENTLKEYPVFLLDEYRKSRTSKLDSGEDLINDNFQFIMEYRSDAYMSGGGG